MMWKIPMRCVALAVFFALGLPAAAESAADFTGEGYETDVLRTHVLF